MSEQQPPALLGLNVDPSSDNLQHALRRAQIADEHGLDLVTIQDHPYNRRHLETWTLLTALATRTERVHVGANVLSTPLRPPAMLAKQAATLDVLSGGRLELGLGAGGFPEGIRAFGGEEWSRAERFRALQEAIEIIKGLWNSGGRSYGYDGKFYYVQGAHFGPAPAHAIRLWLGALGDQMLRLTGRVADGLLISSTYTPPNKLPRFNRLLDEGAAEVDRSPSDVRRGYNLMGVLDPGQSETRSTTDEPGQIRGSVDRWVEQIVQLYRENRQDTFIFWPIAGDEEAQAERFAHEVAPAVRELLRRS